MCQMPNVLITSCSCISNNVYTYTKTESMNMLLALDDNVKFEPNANNLILMVFCWVQKLLMNRSNNHRANSTNKISYDGRSLCGR
jgi:hypothetical protein